MAHRELTDLAVNSFIARLALADILAEDITSAGVACHLADGIILAGIGVTGPFRTRRNTYEVKHYCVLFHKYF